MTAPAPRYTPHGQAADEAVHALIQRAFSVLAARKLMPVEAIAHYVIGDYGRGEGWVAHEGEVWLPYDTPHLLVLLPEDFEEEAIAAHEALMAKLEAVCIDVGYSLRIDVTTARALLEPGREKLAFEVAGGRRLLWSFGGHDPLEDFKGLSPERLEAHGRVTLVEAGPALREITTWSANDTLGLHQGVVRLAFIRCIEVMSALGDAVLLSKGQYAPRLRDRLRALAALGAQGEVNPQLVQLYGAAIALRTRQPEPRLPGWYEIKTLGAEVLVWARHVAHAHFGAQIADPA
ncbi:hypothetical protein J7643_19780 [bacterium]|nr:hypothetical protein [bacterium]